MVSVSIGKVENSIAVFDLIKQLHPTDDLKKSKIIAIYKKHILDKKQIVLLAKINKKIVGYASLHIRLNMQEEGLIGILTELVVDKNSRGQGIGKLLLREITKKAKIKKCKEIHLVSTFPRKRAHKFYENLGFKKTAYLFWKEI